MENGKFKVENEVSAGMKFRYRNEDEMKDSGVEWIGDIPNNNQLNRLKYIVEFQKGNNPKETNNEGIGLPYVGASDFQNKNYSIYTVEENLPKCCEEDLLVLWDGARAGIIDYGHRGIISSTIVKVNNKSKDIITNYYNWYMKNFEKYFIDMSNGTTIPHMSREFIEDLSIPNLSFNEQDKIAKFLDEKTSQFDSIISKKEALIQKLEEAKKSLISEVVTGKVKVIKSSDGYELVERKKEEMKDSGVEWLGYIPKEWMVSKLKYNLSKIGSGKTPKGGAEVYVDTGVVFIRSQNVYNDGLRLDDVVFISDEINNEMNNTAVKYDDILLNITGGSIGRSSIVDIADLTANVNQHVCILRPILKKINPILLHSIVQSNVIQTQIKSFQNASNREGLNFEQIADMMLVKSNDNNEQNIIAKYIENVVNDTNNIIKMTRVQIEKLKEAKQSLISEAVTGKIEIL